MLVGLVLYTDYVTAQREKWYIGQDLMMMDLIIIHEYSINNSKFNSSISP